MPSDLGVNPLEDPGAYGSAPDLYSLQFPWNTPDQATAQPDAPQDGDAAALPAADAAPPIPAGAAPVSDVGPLQPGLGIPASSVDAVAQPAPVLGPTMPGEQPLNPPGQDVSPGFAPPPAEPSPPLPWGATAPREPGEPTIGPPAPGVRDLTDVSIDKPDHAAELANQYAGHVLDIPDDAVRERAWMALPPEERARQQVIWQTKRDNDIATQQLKESEQNRQRAQDNLDAKLRADAETKSQMDDVNASVQRILSTKADPTGGLSTSQRVAGVLMGIVGGLYQGKTGGQRNAGLDAFNDIINRHIEAQKQDLANQLQAAGFKRSALADEYARHGDVYRAQETLRIATYQDALNTLATQAQLYDPRGSQTIRIGNAMSAISAQKAAAEQALGQELYKRNEAAIKLQQEQQKIDETHRHNVADEGRLAAKAGAGAGSGVGGATNPSYTVATGWWNPFDRSMPVMGKRAIGGKGEDAKERDKVGAQINTYGHVQDYWSKLQDLGDRIGYAKSLGESAWKARRGTLESEYDAAKEALTVYLTKELGDKLTQGQLEAQAHRIPDRASVFEARDPGAQISAAQEDADRDFARDMSQVGIDPDPIIKSAQVRRTKAQPTPEQDVDAARAALAQNPEDRDAQRAVSDAEARLKAEVANEQQRTADVASARSLPANGQRLDELDASKFDPATPYGKQELGSLADINAAVREANRSTSHYEALRARFKSLDSADHLKGLKQPGDVAAANRAHAAKLAAAARDALTAQKQADEAAAKARELLAQKARQRAYEQRTAAFRAGVNPDAPPYAQLPYNPVFPDRSFAPGANPFEGPENASVAPGVPPWERAPAVRGRH